MLKFFAVLVITLEALYIIIPTKLFSDLYLARFLNTTAKSSV